jgi:hypothetical protein
MPFQNYKNTNNAQGQLLAGISASATSLILGSGQWALFPSTFPFFIKMEQLDTQANNYRVLKREIAKVTNRVADTFTIMRSSGTCPPDYQTLTSGTTAFSFSSSDVVTQVLTAEQLKDIQDSLATAAQISQIQNQSAIYGSDTGSVNAYAMTLSPAPTAYQAGQCFAFKAANTNTGSATINVNGLGTKTLYKLWGSTTLWAWDILSGQIVNIEYDGTNFQVTSPLGSVPNIDINGLSAITLPGSSDAFIEYNVSALGNKKILFSDLKWAISKRGWDGSDGTLNWAADITLTGSNNTLIVKNYSSISAGSMGSQAYVNDPVAGANIVLNMSNTSLFVVGDYVKVSSSAGSEIAQVTAVATNVSITVWSLSIDHTTTSPLVTRMTKITITPTNCLVYIKVKGNADLTNWVFDFIGKGWPGGNGGSGGWGSGGTGTQGATNFAFPWSGGGGWAYGWAPGAPTLQAFKQPLFAMFSDYFIGGGSGGGWGGSNQNGSPSGAAWGSGGGCVILEVMGNVTLGTAVTNVGNKQNFMFSGTNGGNNGSGAWAWWGGGGGSFLIAYAGTLTGTSTYNLNGGTGGTGGWGGPYPGSSWAGGCSMIATGTGCTWYNYVSWGTSGTAGNGAVGFYTFLQINTIA